MRVAYARTSTTDQEYGLASQHDALLGGDAKADRIFSEQLSSVGERPQLEAALDFVREGDTLVVTRLDRLARSTADLLAIIARLEAKGVALRILDFGGSSVDTQSPTGRLMLTMFGALAEWERSLMLARQREGIQKAKAAGKYRGRAPTARAKAGLVRELNASGAGASQIAKTLGIGRASVYRLLAEVRSK